MKNILYTLLALLLFTACKKETKIERNLYNNGGKWEIVKYEEIVTSTWPANEKNEVYENHGIIQFNKVGSGWMVTADEYFAYKDYFNYRNTDAELTLSFYEGGSTDTYEIDWKKNSFTLTMEGTSTYTPGNTSLVITDHRIYRYTCEKE